MVNNQIVHIVMPVKDSPETTEQAIRAIISSGHTLSVYDDRSTPENAARLDVLRDELGFTLIHISEHTDTPSPNYRWVLQQAQTHALHDNRHLVIVESDVLIKPNTIARMTAAVQKGVGMVAAVTHDEQGKVNFPYEYAARIRKDGPCAKRLSFCCTLLTNELLHAISFATLDPEKNWYDVYISHQSLKQGFTNILQVNNPVLHRPHSSRPWKQLKYTNPILYYWRKLTRHLDKI